MEIERKFRILTPPDNYKSFPFHQIEQAYLCTCPVIRVRKQDEEYYLTYKSAGLLSREEYNLPLNRESYGHLLLKADGNIVSKRRYLIPADIAGLTIEFDVFDGIFKGLMLAEVEFSSEEEALTYTAPAWFSEDVTLTGTFQNSRLSSLAKLELSEFKNAYCRSGEPS